jgi:hypothetical protein
LEWEIQARSDFFETVSQVEVDGSLPFWATRSANLNAVPAALTAKTNAGVNQ